MGSDGLFGRMSDLVYPDLPAPVLASYTEAQLRFTSVAWPMRASEELRSARTFRALAQASRALGQPDPWPARLASAMRDEVRHARLCATVGAALGAPWARRSRCTCFARDAAQRASRSQRRA
jgi:hypothetical protein